MPQQITKTSQAPFKSLYQDPENKARLLAIHQLAMHDRWITYTPHELATT